MIKKEVLSKIFVIFTFLLIFSSFVYSADDELDIILNEEFNKSREILLNQTREYMNPLVESLKEVDASIRQVKFNPEKLNKILSSGEYIEVPIIISNSRSTSIDIIFEIDGGVSEFIFFKENNIEVKTGTISILSKTNKTVILNIVASQNSRHGLRTGYILFKNRLDESESYKYSVNVDVLKSKSRSVDLHITPLNEHAVTDVLKLQVEINNNLQERFDSRLKIFIDDFNTHEELLFSEYSLSLDSFYSGFMELELPSRIEPGKYLMRGELKYPYQGDNVTTKIILTLDLDKPLFMRLFLGLPVGVYFFGMMLIFLIIGTVFYIRFTNERKKRYHLPVILSTLALTKNDERLLLGKLSELDKTVYYDMDNLMTHTIVAGSTGGGKTVAAQDIVEEALNKKVGVVVFDPTAQWTGFFRKNTDKKMMNGYVKFGMKPKDARSYPGTILVVEDALQKIDLKRHLVPGEINVFSLHKLEPKEIDIFVASTVKQVFAMHMDEATSLKYLLVYDEVHRLLPKFGGSGAGFMQIERAAREFRKWGLGLILISQVLSDFIGEIKANINTEIQLRTKDENDLERLKTKYGDEVLRSVVKAETGNGMLVNPSYNRGKPFMVNFRPLLHDPHRMSEKDLNKYIDYSRVIDEISYNISLMKEQSLDVFDLELELKLSKEKLAGGSFTMVEVYLEGLNNRLDETLSSNSLKREKVRIEKIDIEELKEEIRLATEDHSNG